MPSARFLLAIFDGGGTVPPALGVAAELVRRGHTVLVLADPTVERSARAAGCAFRPWSAAPHVSSDAEHKELLAALEGRDPYRRLRAAGRLVGPRAMRGFADDVLAAVRDHPVDGILAEAALPGILLGAEAAGVPCAALMPNIYIRPTPGRPLMGAGWSPATNTATRVRDAVTVAAARRALAVAARPLNRVRADHGLPPVREVTEQLDRCAAVLVMTSPTFDVPAVRLPSNVRYVGPQTDDPAWATSGDDWRPDGTGPLVLVGMSSVYQNQTRVLGAVAAALGSLPVRGVLTTGRAVEPADVACPPNVRAVRSAPHGDVLREAAAVVTHAGHGTVLKALAAGVPLVCLPMGRDQRDNTTRVVRLGAGVRVDQRASPTTIADAVRRVLEEPRFADAARRMADVIAAEAASGPDAADEVEAMVSAAATGHHA